MPLSSPRSRGEAIYIPFIADTDDATEKIDKLQDKLTGENVGGKAFMGGLLGGFIGGIGFDAIINALGSVRDEFQEIVELAEESPELFDAEQLANIQAYSNAAEKLNTQFTDLKIAVASDMAPAITAAMTDTTQKIEEQGVALTVLKFGFDDLYRYIFKSGDAFNQAASDAESFDRALQNQTDTHIALRDVIETEEEALKRLNKENKTLLSDMFKIYDASEKFIEDEEKREQKIRDIEDEKTRLAIEAGNLRADKLSTQEKETDFALRQIELDEKLAELQEEGTRAIEDKENATKKLIFTQLEAKAAQDGLISVAEVEFLQETAVTMGLVDQAAADMAIGIAQAADAMWEQFQKPGEAVENVQDLLNRVVQGGPYRTQLVVETVYPSGLPSFAPQLPTTPIIEGFGRTQRRSPGQIDMNWVAQEVNRKNTK